MTIEPRSTTALRILFPTPGDDDVLSLYVRAEHSAISWNRTSATFTLGSVASFATYFSAFPAAYWRSHAGVRAVTLAGSISGEATVTLFVAEGDSPARAVSSVTVSNGAVSLSTPVEPSCSWVWFEVEAGPEGATLTGGSWEVDEGPIATATVCITTHNRPSDCVGVLRTLSDDDELAHLVERIVVIDQGESRIRDHPDFRPVADALGDRLRVIEQANFGGSGGFSRGMIESLQESASHTLLLDDDVKLEPESLRRVLAFSGRVSPKTIVGAQMLSLTDRTLLHSYGERVERKGFWWTPVDPRLSSLDLALRPVDTTAGLRAMLDVDFNGWWMCLIPADTIRRIGAALPFFIKWDDVEFGLRAHSDGGSTVTLPGAAIWHMPWTGKDDGLDWQAYYQLRNRIVSALIHSTSPRGGGVLGSSFAQDVNHIICLQYGSAAARRLALLDVLRGPRHLPETSVRRIADVRDLLQRAGQVVVSPEHLAVDDPTGAVIAPRGIAGTLVRAGRVALHQLSPVRASNSTTVQRALSRHAGKWWSLGLLDSASVASATGQGVFIARRDSLTALSLLRAAALIRLRLWWRWHSLAREYRRAAPELSSPASWAQTFDTTPTVADRARG